MRAKKFGALLRAKREAAGVSLRELARHLDISPTYLSQVETGKLAPLLYLEVVTAARVLGADLDELALEANRDREFVKLSTMRSERHRNVGALLATRWRQLTNEQLDAIIRVVEGSEP